MDKFERVTLLHRLLKAARLGKAIDEIEAELGISRATVYRDLMFLRDVLGAPLENVGVESGQSESRWRYARDQAAPFELPGIWLSPEELYALVLTRQVVAGRGDEDESLLAHALDRGQSGKFAPAAGDTSQPQAGQSSGVSRRHPWHFGTQTAANQLSRSLNRRAH
jgi:predicted DNA-binding transcriptional regulator YafY